MHPELNPPEAGDMFNHPRLEAASVDGRVGSQLSQTTDVQAARNYFQSSGGQAQLPDLQFDGSSFGADSSLGAGSDFSSLTGGAEGFANTNLPGLESALAPSGLEQAAVMPGMEQGALGAVAPGGETISPLVQMILKLPGLTGIIGDFFSALMAFFFPSDGGLLATLLNPTLWAAAAQNALTSVATVLMHDLPLTLTTFGSNNPFQSLLQNGLLDGTSKAASAASPVTLSLEHQPFNAQSLNVGGSIGPGKGLYEMTSMDGSQMLDGGAANIDWTSNKFLAMENGGNSFGPTLGGSQIPTAQMQTPTIQVQTPQAPLSQAPSGGDAMMQQTGDGMMQQSAGDSMMQQPGAESAVDGRGSLINEGTAGGGTEVANANAAPAHHMVERGDNLWNIAKDNLGSGSRWTEIYDLNKDVIGSNPDLIYSGTDLKLPGTENLASGATNYVVKSGDNLWNIAKDHMGGGQNWHALYDQNANVIGANPDLIHPGQNLAIGDGGTQMQVAHGPSTPAATTHSAPSHTAHSAPSHTAHSAPSHAGNVDTHATHHSASSHHANSQAAAHHAKPSIAHHAKPAEIDATAHSSTPQPTELAHTADSPAGEAATAGAKTSELGKTAIAPDELKQEIGLKAVAKSL